MIDSQSNSDASPKEKSLSDAQPSARRSLSRRKKLAYSLVTTLLFFVLLESGLALLGVEPAVDLSDPFVGFDDSSPLFVPDTASGTGDASRMVTSKNKLAWFNEQSFPRRKPPDTRRVFCLGGSTTYGRPYDDTTSFPGWLRELLPHIAPQARWEVINAGGVSYASYRVARLTQELVQYEPDLLIVYTGHNEFLEDRTYGEIRHASPLQRGALATLARSRTAALAQRMFGGPSSDRHGGRFQLSDDVDTVLDRAQQHGGHHGVVAKCWKLVLMGDIRDRLEIGDIVLGIADAFEIDAARVLVHEFVDRLGCIRVEKANLDAKVLEGLTK